MTIDSLCGLSNQDLETTINKLDINEAKGLLINAIIEIVKTRKIEQYNNRLVKEKFDTTSERVMPPKNSTKLNYEGKNNNDQKKRGRVTGSKNHYTLLAERIINGEGKNGFIDGIPYEEVILESDDKCPICNNDLIEIGEDSIIKVVFTPGTYKLVLYRKKKKVCKNHCEEIFTPMISDSLCKSNISTSFISKFIRDKYQYGVPPYRQINDLKNNKIKIDYNQIIHHTMRIGRLLKPLAEKIRICAFKNNPVVFIDETTCKILNPELKADGTFRKKNYIFGIVTPSISSYTFTGDRKVDWLAALFDKTKFEGCANTDDYSGYNFLNNNDKIKHQLCLCHARRRMFYAYMAAPEEIRDTESCMARKGLLIFKAIFDEERKIKNESIEFIKEYRNSDAYMANVNALKSFCEDVVPAQGSYLEDAISYIKSNWDQLWTCLNDGNIPVSNMEAELAMKSIALVRKNSLFFKNSTSSEYNCYLLSIVQTASKCGLDVYRYLNYVIHHINKVDIDSLLPWSENLYSLGEDYTI